MNSSDALFESAIPDLPLIEGTKVIDPQVTGEDQDAAARPLKSSPLRVLICTWAPVGTVAA